MLSFIKQNKEEKQMAKKKYLELCINCDDEKHFDDMYHCERCLAPLCEDCMEEEVFDDNYLCENCRE